MPSAPTTYTEFGYAESASVDIDADLYEFLAVGNKNILAVVEGPTRLSGTLSAAWVDNNLLGIIYGIAPDWNQPAGWCVYLYRDVSGERSYIWAYDCKIETISFDVPADGFLAEDIDFRATYWVYGSW